MKTTILILCLFFTLMVKGQLSVNVGAGYSSKKSPTAETALQYNFTGLIVSGGFVAHISNDAGKGAIFFGKLGYCYRLDERASFEFSGGYGHNLKSTDNKALNENAFIGSAYGILNMKRTELGAMYVGFNWFKSTTIFSVGLRLKFARNESKYGCNYNY